MRIYYYYYVQSILIYMYNYVYIFICAHIMRVCIYKFNSMCNYIYIYMLGAFEILVGDLFVNAAKLARTNNL